MEARKGDTQGDLGAVTRGQVVLPPLPSPAGTIPRGNGQGFKHQPWILALGPGRALMTIALSVFRHSVMS